MRSGARGRARGRWTLHDVALLLAFAGIMTTGIVFTVGGFNFALERAYGLLLIALLVGQLARPALPAVRRLLWTWAAWWAVLFVAALASGRFAAHLPPLLIAIVPVAYFALVTSQRLDGAVVDRIVRGILWIAGTLGVFSLVAFRALGSGRQLLAMVDSAGRLKLTVIEPNLLGSTMGFLLLLSLPRARLTVRNVVMYVLALVTLLGAFSKAPLLAFGLGVFLFGMFRAISRRSSLSTAVVLPIWAAAAGGALLLALLPSATDVYDRFLARDDAVMSRTYLLRLALSNFWTSPVIGRGPGDFGLQNAALLRAIGGQEDISNLWISQMMINIMHDSGVVGLVIYCVFLAMLLHRGFKWVRAGSLDHCGYLAGFVSVLVASQASTVHLNAVFGLAAGLVAALPLAPKGSLRTVPAALPGPDTGNRPLQGGLAWPDGRR